jgi:hypothetical protein
MISINETLREEYWSQAGVLIIVLCMAFEDSSYGWNTALKFHDALYHVIVGDNHSISSFLMQQMITRITHAFHIKSIVMPAPLSFA